MPDVIYMKKDILITKLNKNLLLHKQIYKETILAFKKNYTDKLRGMLIASKKNKFETRIDLVIPENHEEDYIRAISMIEMNCRDEIALREDEFNEYVLNRWNWISNFRLSYISNYHSSSSSSAQSSTSSRSSKSVEQAATVYFSGIT